MIYLDNAATTKPMKLDKLAVSDNFANPSGAYGVARDARDDLDKAERCILRCIGSSCEEDSIIFTSGGSEGNNMVLRGVLHANRQIGKHVITTTVEHPSVLNTLKALEEDGLATVTYLPVSKYGAVTAQQVAAAIRDDTVLVSVMMANNEVGTINPISEIGKVCHHANVLFHTDAVQAAGQLPISVSKMNVDLLTISGHKFHGPKGIGAVYVAAGVRIDPLIYGGHQNYGLRAGTENVQGAILMALALGREVHCIDWLPEQIAKRRDRLIDKIMAGIPDAVLNGAPFTRLPNNVSLCIPGVHSESLLLMLDIHDLCASAGSACTTGILEPSHVLRAMGVPDELSAGSLRLTLSGETTVEEVDEAAEIIINCVRRLRSLEKDNGK